MCKDKASGGEHEEEEKGVKTFLGRNVSVLLLWVATCDCKSLKTSNESFSPQPRKYLSSSPQRVSLSSIWQLTTTQISNVPNLNSFRAFLGNSLTIRMARVLELILLDNRLKKSKLWYWKPLMSLEINKLFEFTAELEWREFYFDWHKINFISV